MTKSQIIQRLLDKKHITVEEAMTLMQHDTIPVMPTQPVQPYHPPYRPGDIWYTYTTSTGPIDKQMTSDAINSINDQARKTILND